MRGWPTSSVLSSVAPAPDWPTASPPTSIVYRSTSTGPAVSGTVTSRRCSRAAGTSSRCHRSRPPDSVFVEDTAVMFGSLAILANPGAAERRDEVAGTAGTLAALGCRTVAIVGTGRLDGGDVLKLGRRVYVGRGGRTNAEGVRQLRAALTPLGAQVTAVPLTKALHLKSAVTALPDGTVIGWLPVVDDPAFFPRFVAVPEEPGAHVVDLGDGRLLMSAAAPRSAELVADLGYTPVAGRHLRIREARRLCHLPVDPPAPRAVSLLQTDLWRWVRRVRRTHRHPCRERSGATRPGS